MLSLLLLLFLLSLDASQSLSLADACAGITGCKTYISKTGAAPVCDVSGDNIYETTNPFMSVNDNYVAYDKSLYDSSDDSKEPIHAPKVQVKLVRYSFAENQIDINFDRKELGENAGVTIFSKSYQWKYFMQNKATILQSIHYKGVGVFYLDITAMDYFQRAECSLMTAVTDQTSRTMTTTTCPTPTDHSYAVPNTANAGLTSYVDWLNNLKSYSSTCGRPKYMCSSVSYKSTLTVSNQDVVTTTLSETDIPACYDLTSGDLAALRTKAQDLRTINGLSKNNGELSCSKTCDLDTQPKEQYVDFNCGENKNAWSISAECVSAGDECAYKMTSTIRSTDLFEANVKVKDSVAAEMSDEDAKAIYIQCSNAAGCLSTPGLKIKDYLELTRSFRGVWDNVLRGGTSSYIESDYIVARVQINGGSWYDWDDVVWIPVSVLTATITVEIRTPCGDLLNNPASFTLEQIVTPNPTVDTVAICSRFAMKAVKDVSGNAVDQNVVSNIYRVRASLDFVPFSIEFKPSDYGDLMVQNMAFTEIQCDAKFQGDGFLQATSGTSTSTYQAQFTSSTAPVFFTEVPPFFKKYFAVNLRHELSNSGYIDYTSMPLALTCKLKYKIGNGATNEMSCPIKFTATDNKDSLSERRKCDTITGCDGAKSVPLYNLCRGTTLEFVSTQVQLSSSGSTSTVSGITDRLYKDNEYTCCSNCNSVSGLCLGVPGVPSGVSGLKVCDQSSGGSGIAELTQSTIKVGTPTLVILCTGLTSILVTAFILSKNFYRKQRNVIDTESGYTPLI